MLPGSRAPLDWRPIGPAQSWSSRGDVAQRSLPGGPLPGGHLCALKVGRALELAQPRSIGPFIWGWFACGLTFAPPQLGPGPLARSFQITGIVAVGRARALPLVRRVR